MVHGRVRSHGFPVARQHLSQSSARESSPSSLEDDHLAPFVGEDADHSNLAAYLNDADGLLEIEQEELKVDLIQTMTICKSISLVVKRANLSTSSLVDKLRAKRSLQEINVGTNKIERFPPT